MFISSYDKSGRKREKKMTLRNTAALLHHVMRKKPHIKNVIQPVFGY